MTKVRFILLAGLLVLAGFSGLAGCRSAHTTSAILYIDEQNYDKAVEVIHEGFEYRDDEPDAFYYLAEAHSHLAEEAVEDDDFDEAKKNYELAYEAYRRAEELDPAGFEDKVETALTYNYNNRIRQASLDWQESYYEQAEGHLRLAFAALPDSMTPIKNIARMKMQQAAVAESERSNELFGESLDLPTSPREVLEVCLRENERRLDGFDPRLLRPRLVPSIARAVYRVMPGKKANAAAN